MEYLRSIQLNLMLILSGICAVIALFVNITRALSYKRKRAILCMELGSMILLISDRFAYIYRGDVSNLGYWMVRITNFLAYITVLIVFFGFNLYMKDLYAGGINGKRIKYRFIAGDLLFGIGILLIIIAQFTGLYYTFDETNHYVRMPGFAICYIIPLIVLIIDLSILIQYHKHLSVLLRISIFLFLSIIVVMSFIQVFVYGLSLTNLSVAMMAIVLYGFELMDMNERVEKANQLRFDLMEEERNNLELVFEQTAEALATAIDAKDTYTHGHSTRVAEYSERIARVAGWDENTCREVYYAALLHDVGKIGIPNEIINKDGKLTDDEYEVIKTHPVIGNQILSRISRSPYLSIGAHFHHERYDGKGYPERLKGEDIPALARIIAVADAYDAMTSKRSYRDPIPQQKVKEEIVKGLGTQFDPEFGKIMVRLIEADTGYEMQEHEEVKELSGRTHLACRELRSNVSEGIVITPNITGIHMRVRMAEGYEDKTFVPTLIIFDSLDARVHFKEHKQRELQYYEYVTIRFDGKVDCRGARKVVSDFKWQDEGERDLIEEYKKGIDFNIQAVRVRDHLKITVVCKYFILSVTVALPDSSRFAYIGLTGEYCNMTNLTIHRDPVEVDDDYIDRIAEEVIFMTGPEGDIPNVQVNGWRTESSVGIPITPHMKITFHSISLPTARLVWHCPYVSIYTSRDGSMTADDYREFVLVRLDGENWESDQAVNSIEVNMSDDFVSWDNWKRRNREGLDFTVSITRKGSRIIVNADNGGIAITTTSDMNREAENVYLALTGDQVAITDIHISRD